MLFGLDGNREPQRGEDGFNVAVADLSGVVFGEDLRRTAEPRKVIAEKSFEMVRRTIRN